MASNVMLIVDQYDQHHNDPEQFRRLSTVLGDVKQRIAIVSDDDREGLRAYRHSGYQTISMNGDRPERLPEMLDTIADRIRDHPPNHLVVVTSDPTFRPFFDDISSRTHLSVWASGDTAPSAFRTSYNYRPLERMLPKTKRVDVRLDYENLHIGLSKQGWSMTARDIITAVGDAVADLGKTINIAAYADWGMLKKHFGSDIQRELAILRVDTHYQINERDKNAADMVLADDVRTLLERNPGDPDAAEIIVLGTCDRDFQRTLETARKRGKRVIVLGLRGGVSRKLKDAAGDDLRYLDDYLEAPRITTPPNSPYALAEDASFAASLLVWLGDHGYAWAYVDKLIANLDVDRQRIQDAVASGLLKAESRGRVVRPNYQHEIIQAAQRLVSWVPDRIAYSLNTKGLSYVDTHYLTKGMQMDGALQNGGIAQRRETAEIWLNALEKAGLILRRPRPHPKTPSKIIDTWVLP